MELEQFFSNSKWEILVELSKEARSPLELANVFKTSVANISQQLRLMEAASVIGKTKTSNFEKGKPRTLYHVKEEILYVVRLGKNVASKQVLKRDPFTSYMLAVFSSIPKKDQFFLSRFFCDNSDILTESSIGLFKNQDKSIELFIITEKLDEARKRISNYNLTNAIGVQRLIVCWSHNNFETGQGLKNSDQHFVNLVKDSAILLDEKGALEKFKESLKR